MNDQQKYLLALAAGLLGILLLLLFSARIFVLNGFLTIEEQRAQEHMQRLFSVLDNELDTLAATLGDYSAWDETYHYVQNGDPDYVATNLDPSSLARLRVDLVALVRPNGEIIYSNTQANPTQTVRSSLPKLSLAPNSPLLRLSTPGSSAKGIVVLNGIPVLITAKPVLTNDHLGPIHGIMLMGRSLGTLETAHLEKLTRLSLTVTVCDSKTLAAPPFGRIPLSLNQPTAIHRRDSNTIDGYALFADLDQRPALLIKATLPRHTYRKGVESIRYFMYWSILISLIALIACSRLLRRVAASQHRREVAECLYAAVVERSPAAVLLLENESSRILQATPAVSLLLGHPPEQLAGVLFRELLAGDRAAFERCRTAALREERTQHCGILQLRRHDHGVIALSGEISIKQLGDHPVICVVLHPQAETPS